jgi:hypothetical protein
LRLVLDTELSANKKFKQLDHWQCQYFDTILELLTDFKKNCKTRQGNEKTAICPRTASNKGRTYIAYMFREYRRGA